MMLTLNSDMEPDMESICALALNAIPGVGSVTYRKLVESFGGAAAVFKAGRGKLQYVKGLKKESLDAICSTDPAKEGGREWEKVHKAGFKVVFFKGAGYPANLAEIYDPPPVLYVAGELKDTDKISVAIVGSRDPTDYGRKQAMKISGELAAGGVTVVSGMARGIDSAAHRGAIEAKGRTIAVLGCGLDVVYPPENVKLYKEIQGSGAVVSPFPMGTRPSAGNFPARNRVISGLSMGVLVVQATTPDSGSLITARCALEQGREVFAVPGEAGQNVSRGTNALIKKGEAKLIENAQDIVVEILPQLKIPSADKQENKAARPVPKLDGKEKTAYEKLEDSPLHIDIIARKCNIPVHELAGVLLALELKGLVQQKPGMNYVKA